MTCYSVIHTCMLTTIGRAAMIVKEPLGVVLAIIPW